MYWTKDKFREERKDWIFDIIHDDGLYREFYFHHPESSVMSAHIVTSPYAITIYGDYGAPYVFNSRYLNQEGAEKDPLLLETLSNKVLYDYYLEKMAIRNENNLVEYVNIEKVKDSMEEEFWEGFEFGFFDAPENWRENEKIVHFFEVLDDLKRGVTEEEFMLAMGDEKVPFYDNGSFMFNSYNYTYFKNFIVEAELFEYGLPLEYTDDFYYAMQVIHKLAEWYQGIKGNK